MLAAYCLAQGVSPRRVMERPAELRRFQAALLGRGIPLFWTTDLGLDDPDFALIQSCLLDSPPPSGSPRRESLQVLPEAQVSTGEAAWLFSSRPGWRENERFTALLSRWQKDVHEILSAAEFNAALSALDLPSSPGIDPTLREICRRLK